MKPQALLQIIEGANRQDELAPVVVFLLRQMDAEGKQVFELAELADDVAIRVDEIKGLIQ